MTTDTELTPEQLEMAKKIFASKTEEEAKAAAETAEAEVMKVAHAAVNSPLLGRIKQTVAGKALAELLPIRETISKYVSELTAVAHLAGFTEADRLARHQAELAFLDHLLK